MGLPERRIIHNDSRFDIYGYSWVGNRQFIYSWNLGFMTTFDRRREMIEIEEIRKTVERVPDTANWSTATVKMLLSEVTRLQKKVETYEQEIVKCPFCFKELRRPS